MSWLGARAVLACLCLWSAHGMYDNILPNNIPPPSCPNGCAKWADLAEDGNTRNQADVNGKFASIDNVDAAARFCAMPANDPDVGDGWCYCRGTNDASWGSCLPSNFPSEIAAIPVSPTAAVIVFATTEAPGSKPKIEISPSATILDSWDLAPSHGTALNRTFHFVAIGDLQPKTNYTYRVNSGAPNSPWSQQGFFVSLPAAGSRIKFAIWGDMGVYSHNNMDSIIDAFNANSIDFAAHIGDHGYNIGNEARGDGYFDANQGMYTKGLWVPGVGNHEYYDDDEFGRYDAYTNGIGKFNPSTKTNRYYSLDIGLLHLIVLDSTSYFGQPGADIPTQLAWLDANLAGVDREKTPWILLTAHHPLYCSSVTYFDDHENRQRFGNGYNPNAFAGCVGSGEAAVKKMRQDWEPLMVKYGVDLYMCGHEHNYESLYPVMNDTVVQTTFVNPAAPVHVVSGAGGAPELDAFGIKGPWTRFRSNQFWSYSVVEVVNATTLIWQQWYNTYAGGDLADEFVITQAKHQPFPVPGQQQQHSKSANPNALVEDQE